jgi:hypothetical protein
VAARIASRVLAAAVVAPRTPRQMTGFDVLVRSDKLRLLDDSDSAFQVWPSP